MDVVPANIAPHLPAPHSEPFKTYSNEQHAIRSLLWFCPPEDRQIKVVESPYEIDPEHSIASIGSSISNPLTREVLGNPKSPAFQFSRGRLSVDLHYSIALLPGAPIWRWQDDERRDTQEYVILDRNREVVARPRVGTDRHCWRIFCSLVASLMSPRIW